jgi:3D (Asp-Asp-Asp) domain-containing protein
MIQAPVNSTSLLKRVTRVSIVAAFTASTLALLGATGEGRTAVHKTKKPAHVARLTSITTNAKPAAPAAPAADWNELLVDENTIAAKAIAPAVARVPTVRTIRMEVTAYCPCVKCCGPSAHGVTASGKLIAYNGGHFVAADTSVLPFGTKLVIPGYANNQPVEVADRGGAIKGNKLDLFFPTHEAALAWGRQMVDVTVVTK